MKRIVTLISILFLVANTCFAQNSIAKLKYEEAEEAYTSNNFELTISKIKEVEGLLGTTNPKLLYLKILAQNKMIETDPEKDYAIIENTRAVSDKYLKDYDNITDNEDKYRDIYKISQKLIAYPKSKIEFDDIALKKKDIALKKKEKELYERETPRRITDSILSVSNFKSGIAIEEFVRLYPESKTLFGLKQKRGNYGHTIDDAFKGKGQSGLFIIQVYKKGIVSYHYKIQECKTSDEAKALYKQYKKYFDENLVIKGDDIYPEGRYEVKGKHYITLLNWGNGIYLRYGSN